MGSLSGRYDQSKGLSILNHPRKHLKGPALLHELVRFKDSSSTAIDYLNASGERQQISYRDLHVFGRVLCSRLRQISAQSQSGPGVIPVIIPQCPELYVADLAVLQSGAALCPVTTDVPPERLKFIANDVGATMFLCLPHDAERISQILPDRVCVTVSLDNPEVEEKVRLGSIETNTTCSFDDTAYVMYTSGSTGMPKGVKISHRAVSQSLLAHDEHIPSFRRFLQFASPTFDVSVFEIFFPFFRGATLVSCDRERLLADLPGIIRELNVDAAELTPTVAGTLLRTRAAAPCLRILLTIGEMLTKQVVEEFGGTSEKDSMLYAMYGPTEASIHCTLASKLSADGSIRNIGTPLSTVTAFIISEAKGAAKLEILPYGGTGELAVAGQLASGYLNRPDQTEAAFISIPGYGDVYRTGDRAFMSPSQDIHILGRIARGQVKIRGQRVELGEVEDVASRTSGVHAAVVTVVDEVIVLFCAGVPELRQNEIHETCRSWLPPYMRPGSIVILEAGMPQLPSGKVDRVRLEHDFKAKRLLPSQDRALFTDKVEEEVAHVVSDELHTQIYASTDLRVCGLDSIRAIRIASRLRKQFPEISVPLVLDCNRISEVAAQLKQHRRSGGVQEGQIEDLLENWQQTKADVQRDLEKQGLSSRMVDVVPCSPIQIAMLSETIADPLINFNSIKLRGPKATTRKALQDAFRTLALENNILRSGFMATDNHQMPFVQIIWKELADDVPFNMLYPLTLSIETLSDSVEVKVGIHHALYDGWSWDLIMADLNLLLQRRCPPKRPQFLDFNRVQRSRIQKLGAGQIPYWSSSLRGLEPATFPNLCPVRREPQRRQVSYKRVEGVMEKTRRQALHLGISRQSLAQAAFALLLSAYYDSEDVVFGMASSGRDLPLLQVEEVIGPCLTTLPMRLNLSQIQGVRDLLFYAQRLYMDGLKHGTVTLSDIYRAIDLPADQKLFDAVYVWQETSTPLSCDPDPIKTVDTYDALGYAIVLEAEPGIHDLKLKLTVDSSRIPSGHANIILNQLDALVQVMLDKNDVPICGIWSVMNQSLLSVANHKFQPFTNELSLTTTIQRLAEEDSSRVAIDFISSYDPSTGKMTKKHLTYGKLFSEASCIAQSLIQDLSLKENDIVCILMSKSIDTYVVICAVVLAGAAFCCIDPRTPGNRLMQVVEQSECKLLIVEEKSVLAGDIHLDIPIVSRNDLARKQPDPRPLSRPDPEHLAYAVFTSGSTGKPKGVLVSHKNIISNIEHLTKIYPRFQSSDRLLQACSLAFDVSVFEIFWTWHCGMTFSSAVNDVLFRDLEQLINDLEISHLSLTPSVAALVDPKKVPSVRFLVTAGEALTSKVFCSWSDRGLHHGYGPSETTNICNVLPKMTSTHAQKNVGPPLRNTSLFVCRRQSSVPRSTKDKSYKLDIGDFNVLPKGCVGEIWVGGEQVGPGYTDRDLTARSWLSHPEYGKLYRSGDIGRLLEGDNLLVLGRDDDQVKLRGQRIELGDINATLCRVNTVEDSFTTILRQDETSSRLVSFWKPRVHNPTAFSATTTQALFQNLSQALPQYMVPDFIITVDELPLTTQGKIDKRRLQNKFQSLTPEELDLCSQGDNLTSGSTELSGTALRIAEALAEITGRSASTINLNTSFYSLGLDSISSISLSRKLRHSGLGHADVSTILRHSSVSKLLHFLETSQNPANGTQISPRTPSKFNQEWEQATIAWYGSLGYVVSQVLPCTSLQEAMLSISDDSTSSAYFTHMRFSLRTSTAKVYDAWESLVSRHDLLRTAFAKSSDREHPYAQVVLKNFRLPWHKSKDVDQRNAFADISPASGLPPYRLQLEDTNPRHMTLHILLHHALYDAEAMSIMLQEVEKHCHGYELANPVPFSQYIDHMANLDAQAADSFWSDSLAGIEPSRLAAILPRSNSANIQHKPFEYSSQLPLHAVQNWLHELELSLTAVLQASLALLLSSYFDRRQICFGNVYSGRNLPNFNVDRIVGPCFNTLPVNVTLRGSRSVISLCQEMQHKNLELLPFQPSSLRSLQSRYSADGRSLFDVLLLCQTGEPALDDTIWTLEDEEGDMNFPFILEIVPKKRSDQLSFKLYSSFAGREILIQILENFDKLFQHILRYPQSSVSDVSLGRENLPSLMKGPAGDATQDDGSNFMAQPSGYALSQTETTLQSLLGELTRYPHIEIKKSTTIFDLGLDSINAIQLASKLRLKGFAIRSGDVMENPSLQEIANFCDQNSIEQGRVPPGFDLADWDRTHRSDIASTFGLPMAQIEHVWPCTDTQAGILSQFVKSKGRLYLNSIRLRLNEKVNIDQLKAAWSKAMQRHKMLRTGFCQTHERRHPYAMITYTRDAHELPWADRRNQSSTTCDGFRVTGILESLHGLPWFLTLNEDSKGKYLNVKMLHAIFDAQSLRFILDDVSSIYRAVPPRTLSSVAHALSSILTSSQNSATSSTGWQDALRETQVSRFPNIHTTHGLPQEHAISSKQSKILYSQALEKCARLGASLQVACQAMWATLLAAYTDQPAVTFGVILSGRAFEDELLQDVVFPCLNTLPISIDTSRPVSELLSLLSKRTAVMTRHQHVSAASIKRHLGLENEFFDTVLVLQKLSSDEQSKGLWTTTEEHASAEYALSLEVVPDATDRIQFRLTYRVDLVPSPAADILLEQIDKTLCHILKENTEAARSHCDPMLSVISPNEDPIPASSKLMHELVESSAITKPDSVALEFINNISEQGIDKSVWTYSQLDIISNQVANLLIDKEVQPGGLVAICFDKCPEASFAIIGILKAGAAYVAIDPGAPKSRKDFIMKDAGCTHIFTTRHIKQYLDVQCEILTLDDDRLLAFCSKERPTLSRPVDPEDICYCLYTSGTTGAPKGCLISHRSAVQAMIAFTRIFSGRWTESSKWLQFASFHFDVSVLEQFWSWKVGISVVSVPRDLLFEDLPGVIHRLGITHLDLTPSLARLLSPATVPQLCKGVFVVGGEQVRQEVLDTWGGTGCLFNFYGPSEVTIGCTVHPSVCSNAKPTNIGLQWDNVGTFVLKPNTQTPVIRGGVGELCLSGSLVGKGYLNRPELTNEKFIHLEHCGTRVYRTGDLVRLLYDDSFDFLGRIDDQVKLRGQRLEIGEINHTILETTSKIKDAATIVLKHHSQRKEQLVAFFTSSEHTTRKETPKLVSNEISRVLSRLIHERAIERLPTYMVPSFFLMVDFLPLTANNKTDLKSLKALYEQSDMNRIRNSAKKSTMDGQPFPSNFEAVRTNLAGFFGMVVSDIKPDSRLFELGMDSISAISLSRSLTTAGLGSADVSVVMRNSVVVDLARALLSSDHDHPSSDDPNLVGKSKERIQRFSKMHKSTIEEALNTSEKNLESISPCTPLQDAMISRIKQSSTVENVYFSCFEFELSERVEQKRLADTWLEACERFDILRTFFVSTSEGNAQVVLRSMLNDLPTIFRHGYKNEVHTHTSEFTFQEWLHMAKQFEKVSPWRVDLISSTSSSTSKMKLSIFHGIYDGISLTLLLNAVQKFYLADVRGSDDIPAFYQALPYGPLCEKPTAKQFWQGRLRGFNLLPIDRSPAGSGRSPVFTQSASFRGANLVDICKKIDVTLSALFHGTLLMTLHEIFGVNPSLGIVLSGRAISMDKAQEVVGPMFNTIPCTIEGCREGGNVLDLVKSCHDFSVEALPYQHTPLRDVARWFRRNNRDPLFDCLLVFQKAVSPLPSSETPLWTEIGSSSFPDFPLNVEVEQVANSDFTLTVVAASDLFETSQLQRILEIYVKVLESVERGESSQLPSDFSRKSYLNEQSGTELDSRSSIDVSDDEGSFSEMETVIRDELALLSGTKKSHILRSHPTYFELGLDSVDALKLAARLKEHKIAITTRSIIQNPTVGGMAEHVSQKMKSQKIPGTAGSDWKKTCSDILLKEGVRDISGLELVLPSTPLQTGLLLDYEQYYHVTCYQLQAAVDLQMLENAILATVNSLPVLRTSFVSTSDLGVSQPFLQCVEGPLQQCVTPTFHLSQHKDLVKHARELRCKASLSSAQFISEFVTLDNGQQFMFMGLPHALYDAWSLQLLQKMLWQTYHGQTVAHQSNSVLFEYVDRVLEQGESQKSEEFWTGALLHVQPAVYQGARDHLDHTKPPNLMQRLSDCSGLAVRSFCKTVGVTMQSIGAVCWSLVLARTIQSLDVCFGMVLSGRDFEGSDELVFPTFNTVAYRLTIKPGMSAVQLLHQAQDLSARILDHQHFPLAHAIRLANCDGTELFNTLFTFQKGPELARHSGNLSDIYELDGEDIQPPYAINVEMEEKEGRLLWTVATRADVASRDTVKGLVNMLDRVLSHLISQKDEPLVRVENQKAMICDFEAFVYRESTGRDGTTKRTAIPNGYSDERLTDLEALIRDVFARVSKTDVSQIGRTTGLFNLGLDSISAIKISSQLKNDGLSVPVSELIKHQTIENIAMAVENKAKMTKPQTNGVHQSYKISSLPIAADICNSLRESGIYSEDVESIIPATGGQIFMLDTWCASGSRLFYPEFYLGIKGASEELVQKSFHDLIPLFPVLRTIFTEFGGATYQLILKPGNSERYHTSWTLETSRNQDATVAKLQIHHTLYDAVSLAIIVGMWRSKCTIHGVDVQPTIDVRPFLELTQMTDPTPQFEVLDFWSSYIGDQRKGKFLCGSFEVGRTKLFDPHLCDVNSLGSKLRKRGLTIQACFFAVYARVHSNLRRHRYNHHSASNEDETEVVLGAYLANRSLDIADLTKLAAPTFNIVPFKVRLTEDIFAMAKQIQTDLQELAKPENCNVSMRDIHNKTGLKLDGYINFLKLPKGDSNDEDDNGDSDRLNPDKRDVHQLLPQIEHIKGDELDRAKKIFHSSQSAEKPSPIYYTMHGDHQSTSHTSWCIPSIDVEAKVNDQGQLGVGIFAPSDMLSHKDAKGLLDEMKEALDGLVSRD